MNCPSTKTSPSDKMRYPLLYAKHYCALSDSSKNIKTKELSDFTDVKAGEICRSPTPETVFLVSPETPLLKSPIVKITSACMECAPNVQQDFYGTHVPTSMTVQLHHESSTSSPCTERQLELDFFAVKEVLIELIEPHAYNSYDTQLEVDARTSTNILPNIDDPAKTEDSLCGSQVKTLIETSPYFEKKLRCPVQRNIEAELSPTTDEYQEEMHFGDDSKDAVYKNDTVDTNMHPKYIPPAPTPPPLMAPLAVLDIDTVDDEIINEFTPIETQTIALRIEEQRRRRKKRSSEEKKNSVIDDKGNEMASASSQTASDETEQNAVCPWENQKVSTSGDTFVKTYATLGYL